MNKEIEQKQKSSKWMEDIIVLKARCKTCNKWGICEKMFWKGFPFVFSDGTTTEGAQEYFYFCLDKSEEDKKDKTSYCYEKYTNG